MAQNATKFKYKQLSHLMRLCRRHEESLAKAVNTSLRLIEKLDGMKSK